MAAKRTTSKGTCALCDGQFGKGSMTRHLAKCLAEHEPQAPSPGKSNLREIYHLTVEARYLREYWLHIETAAATQFAALDAFFRDLWLECCGHLSAFRLPQPKAVAAGRGNALFADLVSAFQAFDFDDMQRQERAIMRSKLGHRVKVGDAFDYEYDFGSTTELRLKVVAKRDGALKPGDVRLLARNLPPDIRCKCGQPAAWVCSQCSFEPGGWLCDACGKKHRCGDEMFLPVVNSPRVGVCAYCGPED